MRRILVAVDEGDASERVAAFVNEFFGGLDVEVVAIHVGRAHAPWIPSTVLPGAMWPWGLVPERPLTTDAGEVDGETIARATRTLDQCGLERDEEVVELGEPVDVIRRAAVDRDVDLIVVGTEHKGLVERLMSGSVSRELLDDAPRPVLVVH